MKIQVVSLAVLLAAPVSGIADEVKKIQDNSFLVEEAYNQEAGVVQHIQSFMYMRKSKDWFYTFTQEWPVPDETHQLSYTIPFLRLNDISNSGDLGDIILNYRYQAILKDRIAFSPRLSVILPTGDYKKGRGAGSMGFQTNLPLSLELTDSVVAHWNLGATYTGNSKAVNGAKADTTAFNYGASAIYLASQNFNLMLEAAGTAFQVVQLDRSKVSERSFFINPGVRFAQNFSSGLQIVSGMSVPIGVGPSSGQRGLFIYLSLEHPFK
jgi:hypothetical protein